MSALCVVLCVAGVACKVPDSQLQRVSQQGPVHTRALRVKEPCRFSVCEGQTSGDQGQTEVKPCLLKCVRSQGLSGNSPVNDTAWCKLQHNHLLQ